MPAAARPAPRLRWNAGGGFNSTACRSVPNTSPASAKSAPSKATCFRPSASRNPTTPPCSHIFRCFGVNRSNTYAINCGTWVGQVHHLFQAALVDDEPSYDRTRNDFLLTETERAPVGERGGEYR